MSNANRKPGEWSGYMQAKFDAEPDGADVGPEDERADVSALLSGDRGDVTTAELTELVRLARLGAEVERQAEIHDQRCNLAAALWAEKEW